MPVKKKPAKKKAVRRKSNKPVERREIVSEFSGWSKGDLVWFPMRHGAAPHQGEIQEFHPKDRLAPCASVWDITEGGYRVIPMDYIFEDKKEAKKSRESYLNLLESLSKKAKI